MITRSDIKKNRAMSKGRENVTVCSLHRGSQGRVISPEKRAIVNKVMGATRVQSRIIRKSRGGENKGDRKRQRKKD